MHHLEPSTEDTTLEDEYEHTRIQALAPGLQRLVLLHHLDQFTAVPSYVERLAREQGQAPG